MKLSILYNDTGDPNTFNQGMFQVIVDGGSFTDEQCREVAEALLATSYVTDGIPSVATPLVAMLGLSDIDRDVPLTA
jgi:hypothetical protein